MQTIHINHILDAAVENLDGYPKTSMAYAILSFGVSQAMFPLVKGWSARNTDDEQRSYQGIALAAWAAMELPVAQRRESILNAITNYLEYSKRPAVDGAKIGDACDWALAGTQQSIFGDTTQDVIHVNNNREQAVEKRIVENAAAWTHQILMAIEGQMTAHTDAPLGLEPQTLKNLCERLYNKARILTVDAQAFIVRTHQRVNTGKVMPSKAHGMLENIATAKLTLGALETIGKTMDAEYARLEEILERQGNDDSALAEQGAQAFRDSVDMEQFIETHALNGDAIGKNYVTGRPRPEQIVQH